MTIGIKQQIQAANKNLAALFKAGDMKSVANCYSKNAKLMAPNSKSIKSKKAIQEFWDKTATLGVGSLSLRTGQVEKLGTTAIETGIAALKDNNGNTLDQVDYVVVWKLENKVWKLHWDIFNSNTA
jgi:ketosteroid isomerase-like protein